MRSGSYAADGNKMHEAASTMSHPILPCDCVQCIEKRLS